MNYSRRGFLKAMAVMSGSSLLAPGLLTARSAFAADKAAGVSDDITTWRITGSHFGAIRAKVVGDRVVDVRPFEHDKHPTEMITGIAGLIYSSSRVRYPMVRLDWYRKRHLSDTSQRGDNRFVRVSWDEALDMFYEELERIQKDHGPWALHTGGVGWRSVGQMHSCGNHMVRGIGMHGRSVGTAGDYSTGAGQMILPYVLRSTEVYSQGTSGEVILRESKLIVFWANDPIKNLQVGWNTETHESYAYFEQLKQKVADKSVQVICLDPVKSKTLNYLGAEHQYVNPMTDVPLMLAIAHTLVKEGLYDKAFLDSYTLGFDRFLPYLEGKIEDQIEKTPEWAAPICGIPAERIREIARLMAKHRTQLIFGWAVQRQQHGEQPYWMGAVLAAMLGQIGLPGGGIS
ncbi:MAG TPA: molybdopterin-dependent oxidoreductase, partial [Thauera sp.]|nr:molybdopterin-dependent oxidoreductase [Thauera sp.]